MSRIDVLIFGATGFTGRYAVKEMLKIAEKFESKFTWGVAGRNADKLREVLDEQGKKAKADLSGIPIVIADIKDEQSLNEMAKRAKVILNFCGPYRFYGEPVVKACIDNKTHHVDISGELQYMEKMELKYNELAMKNEVYIVSACGFDSVPSDLGLVFVRNKFEGEVNSVDIYVKHWFTNNVRRLGLHFGTWESAIHLIGHWRELGPLRRALYPKKMPTFRPKKKIKFYPHKSNPMGMWCLPFTGSDPSVINRSQRFFFEKEKLRPIQANLYFTCSTFFFAFSVILISAVVFVLSKSRCGRWLLLKHPEMFSAGYVTRDGPTEEESENTHFSHTFFAEGWKDKLAEPTDKHKEKPNKRLVTRITGKNPGYGATSISIILCGLTILKESDKMPNKGGVYPPGAAFAKTRLIENLNKHGLTFEVIN